MYETLTCQAFHCQRRCNNERKGQGRYLFVHIIYQRNLTSPLHNRVQVQMAVGRVIPVCATTVKQHLKLQE